MCGVSLRHLVASLSVAGVLLCSLKANAANLDLDDPSVSKTVGSLVRPYLDAEMIRSISIGLVAKGKSRTFHFGKITPDGQPPTDQSVYEIGSVSKVFTGILLGDAVNRGLVQLEQPVKFIGS